jgi:hypothetical protein
VLTETGYAVVGEDGEVHLGVEEGQAHRDPGGQADVFAGGFGGRDGLVGDLAGGEGDVGVLVK